MSEDVRALCLRDAGTRFEPLAFHQGEAMQFRELMEILRRADPDSIVSLLWQFSDADVPEELPEVHFLHNHERANVVVNRIRAFGMVGSHG